MLGPANHQNVAWLPLRWVHDEPTHKGNGVVSRVSVERNHYPLLHVLPEPLLLASSAICGYAAADATTIARRVAAMAGTSAAVPQVYIERH